mmetsp:Transcript_20666/g.50124  ORF Transcript_20666/g.50124 Transcript_20666/m.50124 type:complete len:243 (+) Transcript_20666:343-1071(+)
MSSRTGSTSRPTRGRSFAARRSSTSRLASSRLSSPPLSSTAPPSTPALAAPPSSPTTARATVASLPCLSSRTTRARPRRRPRRRRLSLGGPLPASSLAFSRLLRSLGAWHTTPRRALGTARRPAALSLLCAPRSLWAARRSSRAPDRGRRSTWDPPMFWSLASTPLVTRPPRLSTGSSLRWASTTSPPYRPPPRRPRACPLGCPPTWASRIWASLRGFRPLTTSFRARVDIFQDALKSGSVR